MVTIGDLEVQFRELRTSLDALPDVSEPPNLHSHVYGRTSVR